MLGGILRVAVPLLQGKGRVGDAGWCVRGGGGGGGGALNFQGLGQEGGALTHQHKEMKEYQYSIPMESHCMVASHFICYTFFWIPYAICYIVGYRMHLIFCIAQDTRSTISKELTGLC